MIPGSAPHSRNPVSINRHRKAKKAESNIYSRTRRLSPHPGNLTQIFINCQEWATPKCNQVIFIFCVMDHINNSAHCHSISVN